MNIASIISESLLKAGGYEIFTYNLLNALARKGHQVTLYISDREARKNGNFYKQAPFNYRPLPWKSMSVFKRCPSLLRRWFERQQRRHGYDVWQVMGAYPEGELVSNLSGKVPLVLRTHGDDIQAMPEISYGMRLDPVLDKKIRAVLGRMDRVIALTDSVTDELLGLGVPQERIKVIPNGINADHFAKERDIPSCRGGYGIKPDDFLIVTVGRNHPKKGFDLIPTVAAALVRQGMNFKWLVVGQNSEALRPQLKEKQLLDRVRTVPSITPKAENGVLDFEHMPPEELVEIYAMADLFFFPSRIETFGRVLLESMAAGTPVVTTDCLGCRDVVAHGKYGVMVPVDDTDEMIRALATLTRDRKSLQALRKAGLERARQFSWDIVADQYLVLYSSLKESLKTGKEGGTSRQAHTITA